MAATHLDLTSTTPVIFHNVADEGLLLYHATVIEHIAANVMFVAAESRVALRAFASQHYTTKDLGIEILQHFCYELVQKSHSLIHPRDLPSPSRSMEEYNAALNRLSSKSIVAVFKDRYPDACAKCLYNLSFLYLKTCLQRNHAQSIRMQPRVHFGKQMTRLTKRLLSFAFKHQGIVGTFTTHKYFAHRFQKAMMYETHYVSSFLDKYAFIRSRIALLFNHSGVDVENSGSVRTENVVASVAQYLGLDIDVPVNWAAVIAALIIMAKDNSKLLPRGKQVNSRLLLQILTTETDFASVYIVDGATSKLIFHTR